MKINCIKYLDVFFSAIIRKRVLKSIGKLVLDWAQLEILSHLVVALPGQQLNPK